MRSHLPSALLDCSEIGLLRVRGGRFILDSHLAALYGTTTKRLNDQVKRNRKRFPDEFVLQLTSEESSNLMRSQFATASSTKRNSRFRPYAFSEHGAIMVAMLPQ